MTKKNLLLLSTSGFKFIRWVVLNDITAVDSYRLDNLMIILQALKTFHHLVFNDLNEFLTAQAD